jgi:hypothetical protein
MSGELTQLEDEVLVHSFQKNARGEYRARLFTYENHRLCDVRLFAANRDGDYLPTRKGVTVRVAQLPDLAEAVQALQEEVEREAAVAS